MCSRGALVSIVSLKPEEGSVTVAACLCSVSLPTAAVARGPGCVLIRTAKKQMLATAVFCTEIYYQTQGSL
jgi:hypothetical protein